ncbi:MULTISPECIES: hypothetical protein [unclassified Roseibium]|uniref:hypothetical protein n=1 Tax=unclassified Roseibium TaxID=2629323 RepID=UPI00273DDEE9|nr:MULTISPECIES: hypothetical protein [unclassified Roseibium]
MGIEATRIETPPDIPQDRRFYRLSEAVDGSLFQGGANIEYMMEIEEWILQRLKDDRSAKFVGDTIEIETLDGTATTNPGEWIICDELGELRPCSPVVFNATYEPA